MIDENVRKHLKQINNLGEIYFDEPLKKHTSFQVGGPADIMVSPETPEAFAAVLKYLYQENVPYYIIGNGTNLLVGDGGFRGIIVATRKLNHIAIDGCIITAYAGASLGDVAKAAQEAGLTGMEFASGIPGSIGGGATMNAGAYDGEMKNIVDSLEIISETGELKKLTVDECDYGYRKSIIQKKPWYIVKVVLKLNHGDPQAIQAKMDDFNQRRSDKQPLEFPSAGSTFRRPPGYFAGKLIQDAGFRGYKHGGAQVSDKHTGFIINRDNATAQDIRELIAEIQEKIKEDAGVEMRTEVIFLGEE